MATHTITVDVPEGFRLVVALEPVSRAITDRPEPTPIEPARVVLAPFAGKYAPIEATVDGESLTLPACVAEVLRDVAHGCTRLKFRPETMSKLEDLIPWLAREFERDHSAKVLSNRHTYTVGKHLVSLIDERAA